MAATISAYSATTFLTTSVDWMKNLFTAINVPESAIVYTGNTTANGTALVYKLTKGTGTYADLYARVYVASNPNYSGNTWWVQIGSGWDATNNVLTGAGTAAYLTGSVSTSQSYVNRFSYFKTVTTADDSVRILMWFDSNYGHQGSFGFVQATNTTLTANDCMLTFGAATGYNNTNLVHIKPDNTSAYGPNGSSELVAKQYASLTSLKDGVYPVTPNAPIVSHGYPIGYNSNLALASTNLNGLDRVIVNQGTEEYVALDGNGLMIREV